MLNSPAAATALWLILIAFSSNILLADETGSEPPTALQTDTANNSPEATPNPKQEAAALSAKETLKNLLATRDKRKTELRALKQQLPDQLDEKTQAEQLRDEIAETEQQITALATGISEKEFQSVSNQKLDLQSELQQLAIPFVMMLRSATENARQIDILRRQKTIAQKQRALATSALENIDSLITSPSETQVFDELNEIEKKWQQRLQAAEDLLSSTDSLLTEKLSSHNLKDEGSGLPSFFVGRGTSLLIGSGVFVAVIAFFQLIRFLFNRTIGRTKIRGVIRRLFALAYGTVAIVTAAVATLSVFNLRNDWVLLGAALLAMLATTWFLIKSLPDLIEHAILYLNIGAVQEGERLMFNGIPWHVEKLSFQSELVNPALSGASFTVPIGELKGLHSRPAEGLEAWFPSNEGDWVLLEEGQGQVISQTPSHVEVQLLGGARKSFAANEYFMAPPINLSLGARAEVVFRISHKHKADACSKIPNLLRQFVADGLNELLPEGQLVATDVEMLDVTESAILYEVEADLSAEAASEYETVERRLTKLCVEASNRYGWEIPFQQITLHREGASE